MNDLDPIEHPRVLKAAPMDATPPAKRRNPLPHLAPGIGWNLDNPASAGGDLALSEEHPPAGDSILGCA